MTSSSAIKLLQDMVAIPSVNPMGRKADGNIYYEENLAQYVAAKMRSLKMDVEIMEVSKGRPNAVGTLTQKGKPVLLLDSHLDTVPVEGMTKPFDPVIENGRVLGRGSCDTKATMAMFLTAIEELQREGKKLKWSIVLAGTVDEELYAAGAMALAKKGLRPELGVFGEPTDLQVIHAHKGVLRFYVECYGKSSHSALPELGNNAIYTMGEVIRAVKNVDEVLQAMAHTHLGPPTINPGVVEGGISVNAVPDYCKLDVDVRLLPGQSADTIYSLLNDSLQHLDPQDYKVLPPYLDAPAVFTKTSQPHVQTFLSCCRAHHSASSFKTAPYATDAQAFNNLGVPCVIFGPGSIKNAHTRHEFLPVDELETSIRIIKELLAA